MNRQEYEELIHDLDKALDVPDPGGVAACARALREAADELFGVVDGGDASFGSLLYLHALSKLGPADRNAVYAETERVRCAAERTGFRDGYASAHDLFFSRLEDRVDDAGRKIT